MLTTVTMQTLHFNNNKDSIMIKMAKTGKNCIKYASMWTMWMLQKSG